MNYANIRRYRWLVTAAVVLTLGLGGVLWQGAFGQDKTSPDSSPAVAQAKNLSQAFRAAADAVRQTVVKISISSKPRRVQMPEGTLNRENPFEGTPFERFFDNDPQLRGFGFRQYTPPRQGVGSGVIIDSKGLILTNNHVVEDADEVVVELADGREFKATDIKTDPRTDLAVVRIETDQPLPAATLGDSDKLEIGDWVLAVGNPFGMTGTVSAGIISGKGRSLALGRRTEFLQTDAAINPGNSGGPLVDLDGRVVGINTAIASRNGAYQGVGFAIPVNLAKWVTGQLATSGNVKRAYLGVQIEPIDNQKAAILGIQRNQGVLINDVLADSPAAKAGLQVSDVIRTFAGRSVSDPRDLQEIVERSPAGSKQKVDIIRQGKPMTLQVVVKPLPDDYDVASIAPHGSGRSRVMPPSKQNKMLGLEVAELTEELAEHLGHKGVAGVVITDVDPEGVAAAAGIRQGMLILRVGQKPVKSVAEFEAAVKDKDISKGVLLLVRTAAGNRFVVLQSS